MAWSGPIDPAWLHVNPNRHKAVIAHGYIMGVTFAVLFPLGAIIIRTASFRSLVWIHAAIQILAYLLALAGLGLGVYIAIYPTSQLTPSNGHPIIGIIVVGALAFQPIGGLIHHYMYKKYHQRTIWAITHVWLGRIVLTLGMINGGLGLMLSENTVKGEIAYGVVAGVMWLTWMAVAVWGHFRSQSRLGETGEKAMGHSEAGSSPDRLMNSVLASAPQSLAEWPMFNQNYLNIDPSASTSRAKMAATVTIDKVYFETLLRRAEFHTSGKDLTTPVDIPIVCIPKLDHDNLLRMAHEYTSLKDSLYKGGIELETLEILIRGEAVSISQIGTFVDDDKQPATASADFDDRHQQYGYTMSRPSSYPWADSAPEWPPRNAAGGVGGSLKGRGGFYNHHNSSALEDESAFTSDFEKHDLDLAVPQPERKRFAKMEQRTIFVKNLSDRATHKDIIDVVRGGLVLDIYLRSHERSASISFVEGSAAYKFMNYVKRNDIYVHGKRLEFSWSERQYNLPGHVANKIGIGGLIRLRVHPLTMSRSIYWADFVPFENGMLTSDIRSGATRNIIVRGIHPTITEERIRNDLDHIHNLVVISVLFKDGDAYISLNSISNSLFARTCMMSRVAYKGMKIDWYPDECSEPLPRMQHAAKKENVSAPQPKKRTPATNRFHMLNMDRAEDDSEETDEEPTLLSDFSSMNISRERSPWNPRTIAA